MSGSDLQWPAKKSIIGPYPARFEAERASPSRGGHDCIHAEQANFRYSGSPSLRRQSLGTWKRGIGNLESSESHGPDIR